MIIANSALRASLAIYHLISNKREWNNRYVCAYPIITVVMCVEMYLTAKSAFSLRPWTHHQKLRSEFLVDTRESVLKSNFYN